MENLYQNSLSSSRILFWQREKKPLLNNYNNKSNDDNDNDDQNILPNVNSISDPNHIWICVMKSQRKPIYPLFHHCYFNNNDYSLAYTTFRKEKKKFIIVDEEDWEQWKINPI